MQSMYRIIPFIALCTATIALSSCSSMSDRYSGSDRSTAYETRLPADYSSRLSGNISSKGKVVVIDPSVHAWGAYENGSLVKAGLATAGSSWCPDIGRPCRTKVGHFRVNSLGSESCKSSKYPLPRGGAPMPYCMFFNGNQGMHGSNEVVEGNISHGCVRMQTADAEWLRFNFVNVGTPVVVKPY